ncbi:hypothetical protein MHU86_20730 [Fragilaria crotonensis]|nr:hypothetical protein MHU86_20730 [Fragilaria crotonensis]
MRIGVDSNDSWNLLFYNEEECHAGITSLGIQMVIITFLASINALLIIDDPGIPPLQRVNDRYVMDEILASQQFTPAQLRRLNYCRLYLQAVTLADLTVSNGCQLDHSKLMGTPSLYSSATQYVQINQDQPSKKEWKLWRKANQLWSDQDGNLHHPMGAWTHASTLQRNQHFAYLIHPRKLVLRQTQGYQVHRVRQQMFIETNQYIPFSALHDTAQPIDVQQVTPTGWRLKTQRNMSFRPPPPMIPIAATFTDFINQLPPWEADLLNHTVIITDPYMACDSLAQGFKVGSDGSVRYHRHGSFGWALSTDIGERIATGMGPAQGPRPT